MTAKRTTPGSGTGGPPAVLLVDDRDDKRAALAASLDGLDVTLIEASSGKEALRHLLAGEFAVILLDVNMPVMDGFETASLIRSRASSEHTPIIFVTGINDTDTHVSRGYSLGAVDYIFTPVVPEVLRAKVSVFIDLFRKNREIQARAESLAIKAEQRAATLESRLDALLNRLNVGVFRCTPSGSILSANPAFLRILGLHPAVDLKTLDMAAFYPRPEERFEMIARLERNGQVQEQHLHRRADGIMIWALLSKTLTTADDGARWIDGLIEDITARKQAEDELVRKSEELSRSNAELEQFAYIASHDLQEPLRMVSAFSSLLASRYGDRFDDRGRHFLEQVVDGATRMQQMIRDILSYSRVEQADPTSQVDCAAVIERVLFNLQTSIADCGAKVEVGTLPTLSGDPVMLGQVFQNLIANALKFRRKEVPPCISINVDRDGDAWRFSVADNGIGIQPEHRQRIFDVFQRLHSREAYEGTGIGLAVCRKVLQRHGGRIVADGNPEGGSVFRFWLPASRDRAAAGG